MSKCKVGISGLGHLGSKHLKNYSELSDLVEIIGIIDTDRSKADALANEFGVKAFDDYDQLLSEVDAINICVPTSSHYELAKNALLRNKHTFIEKPIANTVEEAQELTDLAQRNDCTLQIGHIERFNAAFESIKHFTNAPLFIECHRLNQFPNRSLDIGVVSDLMIHDIDIVLGINNTAVKDIQAIGVNVLTSLDDIASVRMTFDNGCVCNLTASRVSDEVMRKIRIFQDDTYISLDYVKQEAFIYKKHENQILKHSLPIEKEQPLKKELAHFIECINNKTTPIVSGKEGTEALKIALEVERIICKQRKSTS